MIPEQDQISIVWDYVIGAFGWNSESSAKTVDAEGMIGEPLLGRPRPAAIVEAGGGVRTLDSSTRQLVCAGWH